jgi:hypothetical protein
VPLTTPSGGGPAPGAAPAVAPEAPAAPVHRPGSDQAMAATIAIMDMSELPMPFPGAAGDQPLPSIEEAVWRHQKRVMKDKAGLSRAETAGEILLLLKQDGYGIEERTRIATVIGADPSTLID